MPSKKSGYHARPQSSWLNKKKKSSLRKNEEEDEGKIMNRLALKLHERKLRHGDLIDSVRFPGNDNERKKDNAPQTGAGRISAHEISARNLKAKKTKKSKKNNKHSLLRVESEMTENPEDYENLLTVTEYNIDPEPSAEPSTDKVKTKKSIKHKHSHLDNKDSNEDAEESESTEQPEEYEYHPTGSNKDLIKEEIDGFTHSPSSIHIQKKKVGRSKIKEDDETEADESQLNLLNEEVSTRQTKKNKKSHIADVKKKEEANHSEGTESPDEYEDLSIAIYNDLDVTTDRVNDSTHTTNKHALKKKIGRGKIQEIIDAEVDESEQNLTNERLKTKKTRKNEKSHIYDIKSEEEARKLEITKNPEEYEDSSTASDKDFELTTEEIDYSNHSASSKHVQKKKIEQRKVQDNDEAKANESAENISREIIRNKDTRKSKKSHIDDVKDEKETNKSERTENSEEYQDVSNDYNLADYKLIPPEATEKFKAKDPKRKEKSHKYHINNIKKLNKHESTEHTYEELLTVTENNLDLATEVSKDSTYVPSSKHIQKKKIGRGKIQDIDEATTIYNYDNNELNDINDKKDSEVNKHRKDQDHETTTINNIDEAYYEEVGTESNVKSSHKHQSNGKQSKDEKVRKASRKSQARDVKEETPQTEPTDETETPFYIMVDDINTKDETEPEKDVAKLNKANHNVITFLKPMKQYYSKLNNSEEILSNILMNNLSSKKHPNICIDLFPDCEDYIALAELKHPGIGTCEMKMVRAVCEKSCGQCDSPTDNEITSDEWLANYISTVKNVYDKLTHNGDSSNPLPALTIKKILNGDNVHYDVKNVDNIKEVLPVKNIKA